MNNDDELMKFIRLSRLIMHSWYVLHTLRPLHKQRAVFSIILWCLGEFFILLNLCSKHMQLMFKSGTWLKLFRENFPMDSNFCTVKTMRIVGTMLFYEHCECTVCVQCC